NLNKKIAHLINEQIVGLKTLKTMAVEKNVYNIASLHFADLKSYKISRFLLNSVVTIMMQPFSLLFISGLFIFTLKTSYFSFSAMIALVYLIQRIFVYIQQLQTTWQGINETFPHLEYVNNYLMESKKNQEKKMGNDTFSFKKDIVFNNVSFSYAYSDKKILNSLNFTLRCGEMLGIVGPSGAGKTTFVDVLLRLHEPQEGTIFIDGLPLSGISLHSWRKNIGYVSQDYFLINDSFLNNIKYYDESISREDAIEAAKMANIYDFIESSANGFDTLIGDRGLMLSNGQRQRIVIARILARKPKLLVFDEATSSLDKESEKKIQQVIENIRGKITIIIIAHRLSTIHHCNTLLVLNDGGVVESGSPDILLSDTSSYFYKVSNLGL
ncbi:ATP-binding cassette domain-containing protein, partial [Candidatus Falkowbacteria bacterium]|nr:ATP-binding cassette domain-containing protein [Candidatus Falkowbacteria bacterium]